MSHYNAISFAGLFFLLFVGWIFSTNRKAINKRTVIAGLALQIAAGLFVFVFPYGSKFFLLLNDIVMKALESSFAGAEFVFGPLGRGPGKEGSIGFILAFQVFPSIIFFAAIMSVLYYYNIMPKILKGFAVLFAKLMKTSGAESLSAASNIFVGIESTITIKPYLSQMTRSELCTALTAGMATVASSIFATYTLFLYDVFPMIAGHLISASLLSAPAAIVMSKILVPETGTAETYGKYVPPYFKVDKSLFGSIISGSNTGFQMLVGIVALLIAVISIMTLVNLIFGGFGGLFNSFFGTNWEFSIENILGYIFYPFSYVMGVPSSDAGTVSKLVGERLILTEVVSYQELSVLIKNGEFNDPRSIVITTYALCGFAHAASVAIFTGGITALAPDRKNDLAAVAPRALLAANLACMMTACIAGAFYTGESILTGSI